MFKVFFLKKKLVEGRCLRVFQRVCFRVVFKMCFGYHGREEGWKRWFFPGYPGVFVVVYFRRGEEKRDGG